MNCVLYGNCQMNVYKSYLLAYYPDLEINLLTNYLMISNKDKIPIDLLAKADMFIYQHINNEEYHPLKFLQHLNSDCKIVKIQSIYFELYFPDSTKSEKLLKHIHNYSNDYPFGIISYGHSKIECGNNSYSNEELSTLYKAFLERISKDSKFDTNIYDYIAENFTKRRLFFTIDHPSNEILKIMTHQILENLELEIKDDENFWINEHMNSYIDYIHDDLFRFFNIEFTNNAIKCHDNILRTQSEFIEFYNKTIM